MFGKSSSRESPESLSRDTSESLSSLKLDESEDGDRHWNGCRVERFEGMDVSDVVGVDSFGCVAKWR